MTARYNSITTYHPLRSLRDQILIPQMSIRIIPVFSESPQMGIAASASTVFLLLRNPTTFTQAVVADALIATSNPEIVWIQLQGRVTPCSGRPCAWPDFTIFKFLIIFEQGIPHFHFPLGPENYETIPAVGLKEIWSSSCPSTKTCLHENT